VGGLTHHAISQTTGQLPFLLYGREVRANNNAVRLLAAHWRPFGGNVQHRRFRTPSLSLLFQLLNKLVALLLFIGLQLLDDLRFDAELLVAESRLVGVNLLHLFICNGWRLSRLLV
jgi:hypothetical protein